jgi:hypothetical protein
MTIFNRTRVDWWVSEHKQIGYGQTSNDHIFTHTLARVMGLLPSRVEIGYSSQQEQLGTGAQEDPLTRTPKRRLTHAELADGPELDDGPGSRRAVVAHCSESKGKPGVGLVKLDVRIHYTFEHELPLARQRINVAVAVPHSEK